jgi:integrase
MLSDDVHFHGLRHSTASRLTEAGASDAQIQAVTGHQSRSMVEHYSAGARRRTMAEAAIAMLPVKQTGNKSG